MCGRLPLVWSAENHHISQTVSVAGGPLMYTLCIRYTLDPNKTAHFKAYVDAELAAIRRSGGKIVGYFLPTDFAGPTNLAYGLIDFSTLASYEHYRHELADAADHKTNVAELERSGAVIATYRSIMKRVSEEPA